MRKPWEKYGKTWECLSDRTTATCTPWQRLPWPVAEAQLLDTEEELWAGLKNLHAMGNPRTRWRCSWEKYLQCIYMGLGQNPIPLVDIKIAGIYGCSFP